MRTRVLSWRFLTVPDSSFTAPADPYLGLRVLSDYSGLSIRTLRSFLDREPPGQALPCYRLAGKILARRSDFDRYMEQYKTQGRPALLRALRRHGLPG
jgi:hypothetical protein